MVSCIVSASEALTTIGENKKAFTSIIAVKIIEIILIVLFMTFPLFT
ncbi:hypothetical protein CM318V1_1560030 [Carnobacterium maltaromaticum]|nr:hypothetical protein CM318V1_1560030 [Carnobacterium maltaromaticum]